MATLTERERRVGLHLPVDVSGPDAAGVPFTETTRTVNISGGGVCFESRHGLAVGARLVLRIELPPRLQPHFGGRPVYHARAVVCRVEHLPDQAVSRIGARFLGEVESAPRL